MGLWGYWLDPRAWSLEPQIILPVLVSGWLYWRGRRPVAGTAFGARRGPDRGGRRWRAAAFYAGLAVLLFALESPIDFLSQSLFWIHMIQHMLLLLVVAPLVVAGAPWLPVWRGLGLPVRRWVAPRALRLLRTRPARTGRRWLSNPRLGLGLFAVGLWGWHLPVLFDLALRNGLVHSAEHVTLLAVGVLYWSLLIGSPPIPARLSAPRRIGYLFGGILACWVLAIVLALAPKPLYAPYASLTGRPGGGSALADQRLGGGIMWAPSMIPFDIVLSVLVRQWLADEDLRGVALNAARRREATDERSVVGGRGAGPGGMGPL